MSKVEKKILKVGSMGITRIRFEMGLRHKNHPKKALKPSCNLSTIIPQTVSFELINNLNYSVSTNDKPFTYPSRGASSSDLPIKGLI
ncbi:hypothetical protein Q7M76_03835 [Candidatus Liberibacter asiaticus]|uniref:Uncharacterized protein n=2 Tax=Liberibacter asiaticus TaxID=34021 RepID=C6XG57_LIBAP|nr:hypothetical protein [Candidatus Liberibacter asiaticus]ACT57360.1 hypothetical protein CLIBASIA_03920 [Candidatus Liberibacter asiaticus str. psy62]AGH17121.1 hypothetical protein WSI_03755 [Candidatus Liberibacter asiaticus str. gxpsy]ALK07435.1 hypothetical protein CD16_03850 [Candidatus Liberibacter asiaticus]ASK52926.1 hypothetical protein B2I23_03900 [Candidatus Liberibacter asiaticus]AWL14248.1 hypothetical protein DIC79_03925 [Candidatus Liberibacter asiaticus]